MFHTSAVVNQMISIAAVVNAISGSHFIEYNAEPFFLQRCCVTVLIGSEKAQNSFYYLLFDTLEKSEAIEFVCVYFLLP